MPKHAKPEHRRPCTAYFRPPCLDLYPPAKSPRASSPLAPADLKEARWHWFDTYSEVPWEAWEAFPGGSAYLDRRYLKAMSGHGKVQCRLGMIKANNGSWLGGILMQAVQSESRSPADHMDVSIGVRIATAIMHPGGRPFRFRTLVAGQGLGSGEHTFLWREDIPPCPTGSVGRTGL